MAHDTIKWLKGKKIPEGPLRNIIDEYKRQINKSYNISIKHIYHEYNGVANILTKMASNRDTP